MGRDGIDQAGKLTGLYEVGLYGQRRAGATLIEFFYQCQRLIGIFMVVDCDARPVRAASWRFPRRHGGYRDGATFLSVTGSAATRG